MESLHCAPGTNSVVGQLYKKRVWGTYDTGSS